MFIKVLWSYIKNIIYLAKINSYYLNLPVSIDFYIKIKMRVSHEDFVCKSYIYR
ncbi:hypothetical protein SAMN02982927_03327 [Sporolactobacillus nakayamae]|uniref:Uncharacterized protein n=1 Tax=Sporolactobacillus nakayamae TaxID=269670 RepID=A0A1I2VZ98_9BACL|nr:hypothetical protein SAMN02982927_03327 [Sporolactobacillus nakayamae]